MTWSDYLTMLQRLGDENFPDARIRRMYGRYELLHTSLLLMATVTSLIPATILSVVSYAERPGPKDQY